MSAGACGTGPTAVHARRPAGRLVILEFSPVERASAWCSSAEYGPAEGLRQACARADLLAVEGV